MLKPISSSSLLCVFPATMLHVSSQQQILLLASRQATELKPIVDPIDILLLRFQADWLALKNLEPSPIFGSISASFFRYRYESISGSTTRCRSFVRIDHSLHDSYGDTHRCFLVIRHMDPLTMRLANDKIGLLSLDNF